MELHQDEHKQRNYYQNQSQPHTRISDLLAQGKVLVILEFASDEIKEVVDTIIHGLQGILKSHIPE